MADAALTTELAIPKRQREVVGAFLLAAFLLFFVLLACHNLFNRVAIIPSLLWLLLVGTVLVGFSRELGLRRFLIDILGNYSLGHFVQAVRSDNGSCEIRFGFSFLGYHLLYFAIPVNAVESVAWSTGQATSMTGRDMNDWSVALWYDHGDPLKSQKKRSWRKPDQDIYIVGPVGRKADTAAFGLKLVEFLRSSGAALAPEKDDCSFVRAA